MTREITKVEVWYDSTDHENEGWVASITRGGDNTDRDDNLAEDYATISDDPDGSELQDAVIAVAHQHDITLTSDDVIFENIEGGYAHWEADV